MIIDTLTAAAKNALYPPVIRNALQAVIAQDPLSLPAGKYTVDGDNLFYRRRRRNAPAGRTAPGVPSSVHRYSYCPGGEEIIGAGNKGLTITPDGPFNAAHDIGFCEHISSESLIHLHPLELAILFPGELHRPMSALDAGARLRKIVVKINNDLL
jgi:YhcH/YjgK/YiaL family protein